MFSKRGEFVGLLAVGLLILFAILFISIDMIGEDEYDEAIIVDSDGKISNTDIYRDDYGIAHISSDDKLKAYYALGYAHASDRLFQIEFLKKAAQGRLSEMYGETHIGFDKFIRTFDIDSISIKQLANADEQTRKVLFYYTEGINKFIETHVGDYPMEFGLFNATPERWTPNIPLLIANYHALTSSKHVYGDIVFSSLNTSIPMNRLYSLLEQVEYDNPSIPFFQEVEVDTTLQDSILINDSIDIESGNTLSASYDIITDNGFGKLNKTYMPFGKGACNLLVHQVKRDSIQTAVLVNDMHSPLILPQEYYPSIIRYAGNTVAGINLIGTPIFLSGRNDSISWGRTYLQGDDINYHKLKVDENKMVYSWSDIPTDSTLNKMELFIDTIKISGRSDLYYYKRKAGNKFLLPDNSVFELNKYNGSTNKLKLDFALMPNWVVDSNSNIVTDNLKLSESKNLTELPDFAGYSLNSHIGVGSTAGDIYSIVVGDTLHSYATITKDIYSKKSSIVEEWKLSDSDRFLSSSFYSNLRSSSLYNNDNRKDRLSDLIDESVKFSYREADMISLDQFSTYYYRFSELIVEIIEENTKQRSKRLNKHLESLKSWNGIADPSSNEYRLLFYVLNLFHEEVISKKLDSRVSDYLWKEGISDHIIFNIFNSDKNHDLFGVDEKEIVTLAIEALENYQIDEDYISGFIIPSTFGGIDNDTNILDNAYVAEVSEMRGNLHSVQYFNNRGEVPVGTAYRFISDMGTRRVQISMAGGTSGNLISDYYDNLIQYWKIGGTVTVDMDADLNRYVHEISFR